MYNNHDDGLNAARGIMLGMFLGAWCWVVIIWIGVMVTLLTGCTDLPTAPTPEPDPSHGAIEVQPIPADSAICEAIRSGRIQPTVKVPGC